MQLKIVPDIENNKIYLKYFKIDSILEIYAELKITNGKIKVKKKERLKLKPSKNFESGFINWINKVIIIPTIITKPLGCIILRRNFFRKEPEII